MLIWRGFLSLLAFLGGVGLAGLILLALFAGLLLRLVLLILLVLRAGLRLLVLLVFLVLVLFLILRAVFRLVLVFWIFAQRRAATALSFSSVGYMPNPVSIAFFGLCLVAKNVILRPGVEITVRVGLAKGPSGREQKLKDEEQPPHR